jgi:molybdate transport system substrate-binding protein
MHGSQAGRGIAHKPLRALALLLLSLLASAAGAAAPRITVFAAASLSNVLQEAGDTFTAESHIAVTFSFAGSSVLARQIESGAPVDVFVSADQEWMDYLQARGLLASKMRANVASNELVLVAPAGSDTKLKIAPGFGLAAALGTRGRLAIGDPASVPAGRYAQASLTSLGVWAGVEKRLAAADNVRTALAFVARGEAPLGIVYATDARVEPRVRIVDVFPPSTHEAITYPAAATGMGSAGAEAFLQFLRGPRGQAIFATAGFGKP